MTYSLEFKASAQKEWDRLDATIRAVFKKKLAKVLQNLHIPSAALHGMRDCYKIRLLKVGYRLVYYVNDSAVIVTVITVGKRDKSAVYATAKSRY